jgi:archaellum component FlaC
MTIDAQTQEPEIDQNQLALLKKLQSRIEKRYSVYADLRKRWKKARQYVRGEVGDDGEKGLVRVNIIKSRLDIIQPSIYAKNPEISVIADERLASENYELVNDFAKTLEILINRLLVKDGKLKKKGKSSVRASLTTTVGWVKLIWQEDIEEDPLVINRIQDTQDNIQRMKMLMKKSEGQDCDSESAIAELEQQLKSLEDQVEVTRAFGFVVDNVRAEDILILDESIDSIDDYANASGIGHRVYFEKEKYEQVFGRKPSASAKEYNQSKDDKKQIDDKQKYSLYAVWEVWDKDSNTVYTFAEGAKEWARDPYTPEYVGEQFYPFFPLQLERVDGELHPKSLVEEMFELQDEYNTSHTQFAEHRKESLPVRVYNKSSGMTDGEVRQIANRRANDIVGLSGDPTQPVSNQITSLQDPQLNPAVYSTEHIMRGFELVSGAQDAAAGSVQQAKTATEAEIMAQGATTRRAENLDVVDDWLTEISNYAAEILLQVLTLPQVQEIVGSDAVWPQLTKEDIFKMVNVTVRAGSTAKPNKLRERDQWAQFAPQITQGIIQIAQFRAQGMVDVADALTKVLDESLKRFDERLTVDMFLSPQPTQAAQSQAPATQDQPQNNAMPPQIADLMQQVMQ